jgi:DNA-binding LacI/PurR family transcriptional regulator
MAVTLKDVARAAGVSTSAVSRTFTHGASVSLATRALVTAAADNLGYLPNRLASSLTTGRTGLVGLIADDFGNPFFLTIFDHFTRELQKRGLRPLLINLSGQTAAASSLRMLREYAVDAVILVSATLPASFARAFRDAGLPIVHAFGRAKGEPEVAQAGINDTNAGRMAAVTLAERGYRDLVFIGGPDKTMPTVGRLHGFRVTAEKQGQTVRAVFAPAFSFAAGQAAMRGLLADGPLDACFGADDVLSLGAIAALREAGLRVPEDVGVIGLNDMDMAGWTGVDLTTIAQPVVDIVAAAVDLALAQIETPGITPESKVFNCKLVERRTLRAKPT